MKNLTVVCHTRTLHEEDGAWSGQYQVPSGQQDPTIHRTLYIQSYLRKYTSHVVLRVH